MAKFDTRKRGWPPGDNQPVRRWRRPARVQPTPLEHVGKHTEGSSDDAGTKLVDVGGGGGGGGGRSGSRGRGGSRCRSSSSSSRARGRGAGGSGGGSSVVGGVQGTTLVRDGGGAVGLACLAVLVLLDAVAVGLLADELQFGESVFKLRKKHISRLSGRTYGVNGLGVVLKTGRGSVLASAAEVESALNRHVSKDATVNWVPRHRADSILTSSQLLASGFESQRIVQVFS